MAKVIKNIYINWDWSGDWYALRGFNVAITSENSNPKNEVIRQEKTGKEKSDLLNKGSEQYEHIFNEVILDDTKNHTAWVQALYQEEDSAWYSAGGITISDDGTSTIATSSYVDGEISSLGNRIDEFSSDNKLTLPETNVLEQRLNEVKSADDDLISTANNLSVTTTNYENAINDLDTYLNNNFINQSDYPIDISDNERTTLKNKFQTVQNEKSILINNIAKTREENAKSYTDSEINTLDNNLSNDITNLENSIDDISSDSKITRAESNTLEQRLNEIKSEDDNLITIADSLNIDTTSYSNAVSELDTFLSNYINQSNYPLDITSTNRTNLKSKLETVQQEKSTIINNIAKAREENAKSYTDSEINTLDNNLSTDISNLQSDINDFSSDSMITKAEANALEQRINELKAEDDNLITVATNLGVSTTNYENAISDLDTYLTNNFINQSSYPKSVTSTNRTDLKTKFEAVQNTKSTLINNITEAREQNAKDYTDTQITGLGDMAHKDAVEKAKLGTTILDGGYFATGLIDASRIDTGILNASRISIGSNTSFDTSYDPSTKETPSGAQSKADTAESNAKGYTDTEISNLGDMALKDAVEKAKLGSTVIDGGYLVTDLLSASRISTGVLSDVNGNSEIDLDNGTFNLGSKLSWDGSTLSIQGSLNFSDGTAVDTYADNQASTAETNAKNYAEPEVHKGTSAPSDTSKLWLDTSVTPELWKHHNGSSWVKATPENSDIDALETTNGPNQAGADVTGDNTANDTNNVSGIASDYISNQPNTLPQFKFNGVVGNVPKGWAVNSGSPSIDSNHGYYGSQSFRLGSGGNGADAEFYPNATGNIIPFSFYYYETGNVTDSHFFFYNENNNPILKIGTDNPEWQIKDSSGESNIYTGSNYEDWHYVEVVFDLSDNSYESYWTNLVTGHEETTSGNLINSVNVIDRVRVRTLGDDDFWLDGINCFFSEMHDFDSLGGSAVAGDVTIDANGITITNGDFEFTSQDSTITIDDNGIDINGTIILDSNGLNAFDSNSNKTVEIGSGDGNAWFKGTIEARDGLVVPTRSSAPS